MCLCNPSIKSPWCPNCSSAIQKVKQEVSHKYTTGLELEVRYNKIKQIVMLMDGLSEDGFNNRYLHDPAFHRCVDLLVSLCIDEKMEGKNGW